MSSGGVLTVAPGGVFVVSGVVSEAAVQDADESVSQGSKGLMVQVTKGASVVVEGSCAGAARERAECPLIDRVVETLVAHVPGQDRPFAARSDGQW